MVEMSVFIGHFGAKASNSHCSLSLGYAIVVEILRRDDIDHDIEFD